MAIRLIHYGMSFKTVCCVPNGTRRIDRGNKSLTRFINKTDRLFASYDSRRKQLCAPLPLWLLFCDIWWNRFGILSSSCFFFFYYCYYYYHSLGRLLNIHEGMWKAVWRINAQLSDFHIFPSQNQFRKAMGLIYDTSNEWPTAGKETRRHIANSIYSTRVMVINARAYLCELSWILSFRGMTIKMVLVLFVYVRHRYLPNIHIWKQIAYGVLKGTLVMRCTETACAGCIYVRYFYCH